METPDHLGGHQGIVHTDVGALDYLIERFDIKSAIDLGCGPGWMVAWMRQRGIGIAQGIDGDATQNPTYLHDFSTGRFPWAVRFDLCWSVEFLEHIHELDLPNVWATIERCSVVFCTHALPETAHRKNHHNCQPEQYWIDAFEAHGFQHDTNGTIGVREASTMNREFVRETGKVFVR